MQNQCCHCGKPTDRVFLWDGYDKATGEATYGHGFDCGCTDPVPTEFGKRLRRFRLDAELSLRDAARTTGMSVVDFSHIETGRTVLDEAAATRLAGQLGMNP
jgi:hypothetical protein